MTLANALVAGTQAYAVSVAARRVGILYGVLNPQNLPGGANVRVETIAPAWNEVVTANQAWAQAVALSEQVTALRATDAYGNPATGLIANIPVATLNGWATSLIAAAAAFETLELATLPA